ncbi:MAG: hypothetical protein JWO95_3391, partial [Verrucomicrobiales bacterium]|nr:hypothetical protein [Verrucomicrobiales bacterium]
MTPFLKKLLRPRGALLAGLLLALPGSGWATDTITNTFGYFNGSNNVPVIDAITWINDGVIDDILTTYPFDTTSTVYFTNRGDITGQVGFRFDTVNEIQGTRRPMGTFHNRGNIVALDSPLQFFNPFFGTGGILGFGSSTTPASWMIINATNIVNPGTLAVGNVGLMRLNAKNIDLTRGTLVAGDVANLNTNSLVSSGNFFNILGSSTGLGLTSYGANSYVNPPQVYDIYWGSTLAGTPTQPLGSLAAQLPNSPRYTPDFVSFRANGNFTTFGFDLPITFPAEFNASEFAYVNSGPNDVGGLPVQFGGVGGLTNYFFNFIFYKTNVSDPAITVTPRFAIPTDYGLGGNIVNGGSEAMVEFGTVTNDIATGFPVTNAFYLLDNGGGQKSISILTNASDFNKLGRPSNLQITTATPAEWIFGDTNSTGFGFSLAQFYLPYNPTDISPGNFAVQGLYPTKPVPYTSGSYGVQVGRQPEFLNGLTVASNIFAIAAFTNLLTLSDPTNDAPRIEINATNLDLTSAYIRSEGVLNINTKHLLPGIPAGIDVGILNGDLASTNGLLQLSHIVSPTYKRVRGDVFAWSGNFDFTATNNVSTNTIHLHILVVDHALTANFTPTFRNLALRGTKTLVQDNLRVINNALFQAKQLTIGSSVTLAQNAKSFGRANAPSLADFLIDTNGAFIVEGAAYLGADTAKGLDTFINRGLFAGFATLIKANYIENSGAIMATNGSAVVIQGDVVNFIPGPVVATVPPNTVMSTRDVTISAGEFTAIGSTIVAGMNGSVGVLNLTATNSLTDNVPGFAGTNNVITNHWQTSGGIVVSRMPQDNSVNNDLFGTEIVVGVTNRNQAQIVWPAQDVGAGSEGFFNNLVVGRLVLDRQNSTSSIRISGTGEQNAIYVDYLELRDFSFSDYRNGLVIDPNVTVYFSASNFEPDKLQAVFPGRLVWANSFTGPNSTKAVARRDGSTCLMNRSLAESQIIDLDNDGIVNASDPFPLDNDAKPEFSLPCPGDTLTTSIRTFLTENKGTGPVTSLAISVTGSGKVTPQQKSPVVQLGKVYNLHAVPTPGNLFAGWSGSISTTQPSISFTLASNMVLNARFVTNPFIGLKGTF